MTYRESLAWLYSLQRFGIKLGLENMRRLMAELAIELGGATVIHVAGTNGKGSVCAMCEAIARAAGLTTGLFTSPHLVTFRERIRINGKMISEESVAAGLTEIRQLVSDWDPHPTFFEITTALALKAFCPTASAASDPAELDRFNRSSLTKEKIDVIVLETGLGGRLDATNAVQSSVSVITPLGLDHQQWLGSTLVEIAGEKAGIIKPHTPVVSAAQPPEAEQVIRVRAQECEAPLELVRNPYTASPVGLRGKHQQLNAALAVAAIKACKLDRFNRSSLGPRSGLDVNAVIARGLETVDWPARFQRWDEQTVIDGAHNVAAARTLAEAWREAFGQKRATVILAILADKDVRGICEALAPIADSILLPHIRSERAADPNEIAKIVSTITSPPPCSITPTLGDALDAARAKSNPILITGSLHFAGEALAHLQGVPAALEECSQ